MLSSVVKTAGGFFAMAAISMSVACSKTNFSLPAQSNSVQMVPTINNKVDVLFISDDSSSMLAYRQLMAEQAQPMIDKLNAQGMDYHLAVSTTSVGTKFSGGTFVGTPKVLTTSSPSVGSSLKSNLLFNLPGSDLEQGLSSMELALSDANLSGDGAGFFRKDAMLAVIVLSDDDDYSPDTVGNYKDFLNKLKPPFANGAPSWVVNYIGNLSASSACSAFANVGTRYMNLVAASGGVSQAVCNANWSIVMNNIQAVIGSLATNYYFSVAPNVSTISVKLNGAAVPQNASNGWTYQTGTNSSGSPIYYLVFHGNFLPKAYDVISVSFTPATAN